MTSADLCKVICSKMSINILPLDEKTCSSIEVTFYLPKKISFCLAFYGAANKV